MSKEQTKPFTPTAQLFADELSLAATAPACLLQIYGSELGKRVELARGAVVIGRDETCELGAHEATVSRRHARVFASDGAVLLEDLGSTNGTFVNEEEIRGPRELRNGDAVRCGGAVFKFIAGGDLEALYHEEIHRLAITDGLTQVANRRCLLEFLDREVARASRHGRPLALAMLDVDRFKGVNDRYGHLAGDRVLKGIADVLRARVRREELLARYGGEEFVLVLPETTLENGRLFCERLRGIVEAERFEFDGEPIRVTLSVGVAALAGGESSEALVRRADALLYRAKDLGRNRVEGC